MLKFILIQWGTFALFTAPLQPPHLIIPGLSRGVHHSASQILISCSLPLPRRKQKTAVALVASGEAKAEGHQRCLEETNCRARNQVYEDAPHLLGCAPAGAASFPRGVTTTLGTRYLLSMREGHTASPVMDPASTALFFYTLSPFRYKLLIKQFLCCSVSFPFHGTTALTLGRLMGRNSTESVTTV